MGTTYDQTSEYLDTCQLSNVDDLPPRGSTFSGTLDGPGGGVLGFVVYRATSEADAVRSLWRQALEASVPGFQPLPAGDLPDPVPVPERWSLTVWRAGTSDVVIELEDDARASRRDAMSKSVIKARWSDRPGGVPGPVRRAADAVLEAIPAGHDWHRRSEVFQVAQAALELKTDSQLRRGVDLLLELGAVEMSSAKAIGRWPAPRLTEHSRFLRRAAEEGGAQ